MGYTPGSALGKDGSGRAEPVEIEIRRSRAGLGRESHEKEKARREGARAEWKRWKEEDLMADFGSRQKLQWRIRRIAVDYDKAKKALAQLENEEILEPEKEEEEGEGEADDEEEEEITEEVLYLFIVFFFIHHSFRFGLDEIANSFDVFSPKTSNLRY